MTHPEECRKRDKRTLVLLVFGASILLAGLNLSGRTDREYRQPYWLEIQGTETELYRFTYPGQLEMLSPPDGNMKVLAAEHLQAKDRAFACARKDGKSTVAPATLSPALSFFLRRRLPVNSADREELLLIPGVGPCLADNILQYRKREGRIDNTEKLTAIPGIGKIRARKLSSFITFE